MWPRITQQAGQAVVLGRLSLTVVLRLDLHHTVSLHIHNHLLLLHLLNHLPPDITGGQGLNDLSKIIFTIVQNL